MRIFKKNENKKTTKLPMTGKVEKGFRRYCVAVLALTLMSVTSVTAFAASDPIQVVNNLSDFIFGLGSDDLSFVCRCGCGGCPDYRHGEGYPDTGRCICRSGRYAAADDADADRDFSFLREVVAADAGGAGVFEDWFAGLRQYAAGTD